MSLDRRGRVAEKKGERTWSRGIDPLPTKLERSPRTGNSWKHVRPNEDVEAKENRQMDWRVDTGPRTWGPRPVTMERQKSEIPEDPSQTLPERSPMDPIW